MVPPSLITTIIGILPRVPVSDLPHLFAAGEEFEINTPERWAMFLAQLAHESCGLTVFEENLNYSSQALQLVFKKYFPDQATAARYARQPEKIANRVYANRMQNGPEPSGDGWKYRGRGPIQITGKENYQKCGAALGLDLVQHPELLEEPQYGYRAAAWFWASRDLNACADCGDVRRATRLINGGLNGLEEREKYWRKFQAALKV